MIELNESMRKVRLLAVIQNCSLCAKYKTFIERMNLELPMEKRIRVINSTNLNSLGVFDYGVLRVFDKFMKGSYPFLFLDGMLFNGANSSDECEAFLRAYLHKEFIIDRENPFLFNKNCRYEKKGIFGRKVLICGEEE